METLHNGFTLQLCDGAFPLSTDSIALSGFVKLPKEATVLDLGSGCGTLGLLLCAKDANCTVVGVEINEDAHNMALRNAQANGITSRLTSICADLRAIPSEASNGNFHCCVSNPPYFAAGPEKKENPFARHQSLCSPEELFRTAAKALRFGGDFFLVHKPERLAELCACAVDHNLTPKRLMLLRHKTGDPVSLIFLQCRKGAKHGLIIEEEYLHNADGTPSEYYRRLYHI